jgi:hypothetical protein
MNGARVACSNSQTPVARAAYARSARCGIGSQTDFPSMRGLYESHTVSLQLALVSKLPIRMANHKLSDPLVDDHRKSDGCGNPVWQTTGCKWDVTVTRWSILFVVPSVIAACGTSANPGRLPTSPPVVVHSRSLPPKLSLRMLPVTARIPYTVQAVIRGFSRCSLVMTAMNPRPAARCGAPGVERRSP